MQNTILEKAKELFLERGVKTVTMDDIAREMGISKKTIYAHYSSKEDLLEQSFNRFFYFVIEKLNEVKEKGFNPIEELFKENEVLKEIVIFDERKIQVLHDLEKYYPKIADNFLRVRIAEFEKNYKYNLERGIKQGLYRENLPIDFIVKNHFACTLTYFNKAFNKLQITRTIDEVSFLQTEYFLRSIVTPKGLEILEQLITHKSNIQ